MRKIIFVLSSLLIISACSSKTDKEYLAEAEKLANEKKFTESIEQYNLLLTEYPESEFAPKALFQIASLYQNHSVPDKPVRESFIKAKDLFREVYDKYPKSEPAPMSLFMSGFILANNLNMFEEAKKTYQLFLEKFPDNELAVSAKEELDNIGLTPEEILNKKIAAQK